MSRHWMPMYWADFKSDTEHLGALETGAYMMLIGHYWMTGSLPDDDKRLARIARMTPDEWAEARDIIAEFFYDGWKHKRIDQELAEAQAAYDRRANAGRRGGHAKAEAASNAKAMPEQCHSETLAMLKQSQPQPQLDTIVSNNKPREASPLAILSECMSEQTARDLIAHRQKLRKPLTARAAKLLARDFVAYGNPEEAAEMMIKNGWQGFHPTWVTNQAARAGPSKSQKGWGSLYAELNGYGDGSGQKRIDENVPLLSGGSVDGAGNRDGDASGLSGNLVELFAGNSR
jgi:uncharacterized protein YdaU (DUF1376 family)